MTESVTFVIIRKCPLKSYSLMSFFRRLFRRAEPQSAPVAKPVQPTVTEVYDFRHIKDLSNVSYLDTCSIPENAYFQQLLDKSFADCEIVRAVPATDIFADAPAYAMPVNFLVQKGEKKIAIVLLDLKYVKRYSYLETRELCKENGVEFMPFFLHLPNEEDYVVERIKTVLG